jgi:DNA-binding PadR family transcriptional regulator
MNDDFTGARRHHPGGRGPWDEWIDQPRGGGRRGHRGGPPPWAAALFGFQQPEQRRGPRVRRGDVRCAILGVLAGAKAADEHVNGYQVIQQIAARSKGEWRPSPGSVYPTIQQLEDEGLVETDEAGGRRAIRLTAAGDAWIAEHTAEVDAVWQPFADREEAARTGEFGRTLKSEIGQVAGAVWQLATQGSEEQRAAALEVLVETRRKLYGILAEGPEGQPRVDPGDDES